MGIITIRFVGTFREVSNMKKLNLTIPEETKISNVLDCLTERLGEGFNNMLVNPLMDSFFLQELVLLNGVDITNLQGIDTPVYDGDKIVFLSVTHGG
jgi:molybdopterin converting factor small subunit